MPETWGLDFAADLPLDEKVARLQAFLGEQYIHESGLMYCHWHWGDDGLRPFVAADYNGQSVVRMRSGFSPVGHSSAENSPWVAGLFLWSQCLRHRVTGDDQALVYAARAFRSLDLTFALTEAQGVRGFLSKPYDWTASVETSPDQYVAAMLGMWAYRPLAPAAARARIDALLPAMADFWRERDYTIAYFERRFRIMDDAYHALTMACLHALAAAVTGATPYRDEAERLIELAGACATRIDTERARMLAELAGNAAAVDDIATKQSNRALGDAVHDPARAPYMVRNTENRAAMWMMVAALDELAHHRLIAPGLVQQAIARFYDHCRLGLRPDWLSHYVIQIDLERGTWYPLERPITPERRAWAEQAGLSLFVAYDSQVCWGDAAARIADIALIGAIRAPALCAGALTTTRALLAQLDQRRLRWMIDPDGRQVLPELRYMTESLSSDVPAFTILTYWRARLAGIVL